MFRVFVFVETSIYLLSIHNIISSSAGAGGRGVLQTMIPVELQLQLGSAVHVLRRVFTVWTERPLLLYMLDCWG